MNCKSWKIKDTLFGVGVGFLLAASPLYVGCTSDGPGQSGQFSFFVSSDDAIGSVSLLGATIGVVGALSNYPSALSAAAFPAPCIGAAGPETDAAISAQQVCTRPAAGETACTITTDVSACSFMSGKATHKPVVFTTGSDGSVEATLVMDQFTQGNVDLDVSEISFDGTIFVTTTADAVRFTENETISATTLDPNETSQPEPTILQVISDYEVTLGDTSITVNGSGNYGVQGLGANVVEVSDLEFPLDTSVCVGPVAGILRADLVADLGGTLEGFAVEYAGCNDADLVRYKGGDEVQRDPIDPATTAAIFAESIEQILSIAGAPQALQPAYDEPFAADEQIGAADGFDLWCRFLASDTDTPVLGAIAKTPTDGAPVAECLAFSAAVENTMDTTTDRTLTSLSASLEGPLTDSTSVQLLGARSSGVPVAWSAADGTLDGNMLWDLDPAIANLAEFEQSGAEALATATDTEFGPFATASTIAQFPPGAPLPLFNCIDADFSLDGPKPGVTSPTTANAQCNASAIPYELDIEFARLGMWVISDTRSDLFLKVIFE